MKQEKRTQQEVNHQIEGLKKERERLPKFSMFGNNNWERIDAQIEVLEGKAVPDKFWQDDSSEDFDNGDNDAYFAATDAEEWLNCEREENLFDED